METSSSTRRMIGGIEETSASFEARYAPRSFPTPISGLPSAASGLRVSVADAAGSVGDGAYFRPFNPPKSSDKIASKGQSLS